MLRRITACLNASALVLVSLAPLTIASAKAHAQTTQTETASKIAPELQQTISVGGSTGSATGIGTGGAAQGPGQIGGSQRVRIVLQTKGRPTDEQRSAIASVEGQISQSYEALNALVLDVPRSSLGSLAARTDVAYISPDRPVASQMSMASETV
ncbi:MAG TPA: hypothetical protein VGB76_22260, partial [Pyrinomonadaceae bacterium]